MYKNKGIDGRNNYTGVHLKKIRTAMEPPVSQRKLAELMQLEGLDIDRHVIRRIENGERFVTDIELKILSKSLDVSYATLLDGIDLDS